MKLKVEFLGKNTIVARKSEIAASKKTNILQFDKGLEK